MTKLRVDCFTISLDGYGAGPGQTEKTPLGRGGEDLHRWMVGTRTFHKMIGKEGGTTGTDDGFTRRSFDNVGAWIMGRNMFGPVRGPWPDETWRGWWGEEPPYHCEVFVLSHHARPSLSMKGGTTFHFVTGGIHEALDGARTAAHGRDVRVGGGVSTVRAFLNDGLIDRMHLAVSPILLGSGEHLLQGIDLLAQGFSVTESATTEHAMHVVLGKAKK